MAANNEDLELLFHAEKTNFLSRNDVLLLAIHNFILEDGARCAGIGDKWDEGEVPEKLTKALPKKWNDNQEKFDLKYVKNNRKFLLSFIAEGNITMLTFKDVGSGKIEGMCLDIEEYVNTQFEDFDSTYKNLLDLQKKLKEDILDIVVNPKPPERKSQRYFRHEYIDPLMVPGSGRRSNFVEPDRFGDPFNYGKSDLDPFVGGPFGGGAFGGPGGSGGGMLFNMPRPNRNPRIPGNLPPGSIPPGARFDPIGPHQTPRPRGPDPDVGLPPPGYDDMFD